MEFIFGLLLSWPALIVLVILGIILEANEAEGFAVFIGIVTAVVAYFFFAIPLQTLGMYAVAYFITGFIWSFWRYKRHVDKVVEEYSGQGLSDRKYASQRIQPSNMKSRLTTWVIVWPFSMVESITGDIIKLVQTAITKTLRSVYTKIAEGGTARLNLDESDK